MCEPSPCVSGTKVRRHRASADLGLKLTYGIKYGNRLGGSVVGVRVRVRVSSINLISAWAALVVVWLQFLMKFSRLVFHTHPEGVLVSAFHPVFHVWSRILEHLCENEPKGEAFVAKNQRDMYGARADQRAARKYKTHKNEASMKVSWLSDRIMGWSVAAGDGLPGSLELGVFVPANLCMSELYIIAFRPI